MAVCVHQIGTCCQYFVILGLSVLWLLYSHCSYFLTFNLFGMIVDLIFYRAYKAYSKEKFCLIYIGRLVQTGPIQKSRFFIMLLSQIFILPLSLNVPALYGGSGFINILPWVLFELSIYLYLRNRYNEKSLKRILDKYKKSKCPNVPFLIIWLLSVFCLFGGLVLAVLINIYIMRPL